MTDPVATEPRPVVRRRVAAPRAVLAVAAGGSALAFIDATIVNVAFPDIRESFPDTSLGGISWVLNAYNIVFAAFLVAAGRIADLLGRKRLFELGIIVFTAASILCAVAPSVETLVAARVLQAIGAAIVVPASLALVLESFPGEDRTHGVALWTAAAALAAGLGPSLGGVLVDLGGWRLAFLVNLPVGVLALVASKRTLVESRAPGRRSIPDLPGALLLAAATSLLTLGVIKGEEWGWFSPGVLLSFAGALVVGALFVRRCTWHRSPMLDLALLRIRSLAVANVLTVVGAAGFYSYVLCNVLFLTTVWGYSVLEAGLAITPGPFIAAAIAGPAGRLADRVGPGPVLAAGGLVWSGGVAYLVAVVGVTPDFVGEWLPGMAILGIGAGISFPVVGATAVAAVSGGRFATATGLNSIARQLGAVLGVALLVAIVGTPGPADVAAAFDRGWTFAAACFAVVAVGALAIGKVERPEEEPPPPRAQERPRRAPGPRDPASAGNGASAPPPAPSRLTPAEFLAGVPMFEGLPRHTLERMAERAGRSHLQAGDWLFREGDPAEGVFVLVAGRLEVIIGEDEVLRVLGPGAVVGELALLADTPRSASIRARRESELLELTRAEFDRLVAEDPKFSGELLRLLGIQLQRSRALEEPGPSPTTTMAVLPLHEGLPVRDIIDLLQRTLGETGRVAFLDAPTRETPAEEAELLERYERDHDHVMLLADPGDPWSDFCLRHADRVVAIAGSAPVPAWVEDKEELKGCELLVVADGGAETIGPWLDAVEPRARHLISPGARFEETTARAARRLAGRSVGLVLSGGGARALAHVGVLDELLASGVVIDRVGGASMGSMIAAMLALGMDPDEIDARCYEEWVKRRPLSDYRIPRHSLIRGERAEAMFARTLPGTIEELERDFFSVCGDLVSGDLVVHRRGSLYEAVAMSMSLPGLVTPAASGDQLLVDGGVLNNLPVDVMAATAEGPVIASDVTTRFAAPTGNGGADDQTMPGLVETLTRALLLGSMDTAEAARLHADLVITPQSDGVGLLEFHQLDRMREAGRRAAAEALDAAPELVLS